MKTRLIEPVPSTFVGENCTKMRFVFFLLVVETLEAFFCFAAFDREQPPNHGNRPVLFGKFNFVTNGNSLEINTLINKIGKRCHF